MAFANIPVPRSVALVLSLSLLVIATTPAHAQTESVLYSFCSVNGGVQCADGAGPNGPLVFDRKGNIYGTTGSGGINCGFDCPGYGVVFEVSRSGVESTLYTFQQNGYADGGGPADGLVIDKAGNLYGTTHLFGGAGGAGNVFKLVPAGGNWTEVVLYDFCSQPNCVDGSWTFAGVVLDSKGNLYGTTPFGGVNGCGNVYKLDPNGNESVLYSFQCNNPPTGQNPYGGLLLAKGSLYGTTQSGGSYANGTVFKLSMKGKLTVLHTFNPANGDGGQPYTNLIMDKQGNLYGTTAYGGAYGWGTVFEVAPNGTESVLYSFCAQLNCADGAYPDGPLVMDKEGNLYGETGYGGTGQYCGQDGCGTVFKLTPSGVETVVYSFYCTQNNGCPDGMGPGGGLIFDKKGNLYGTSGGGAGTYGSDGTVFEVVP